MVLYPPCLRTGLCTETSWQNRSGAGSAWLLQRRGGSQRELSPEAGKVGGPGPCEPAWFLLPGHGVPLERPMEAYFEFQKGHRTQWGEHIEKGIHHEGLFWLSCREMVVAEEAERSGQVQARPERGNLEGAGRIRSSLWSTVRRLSAQQHGEHRGEALLRGR